MAETITLDPSAVATGRTALDITSWVDADPGVDWGDAAIQAYMADQAVGSSPVDYRLPNRMIKIPFNLRDVSATTFASIRQSIQAKAGLFQREGGWIMRQVDSTPLYADIVNATLTLGGSIYQAFRGFDVDAVLQLECLPDWYGAEVTLDAMTATGHVKGVLQQSAAQAVIAGNYPGRCRLILTENSGQDQHGLVWGFRSRHYDSATTAALFYEAEALTQVNGATTATMTGASGGSVSQMVNPPATWVTMLSTTIASGSQPLTHTGMYRVWARVRCSVASTQLRLVWGVGSLSAPVTNAAAGPQSTVSFSLVDLGAINLTAPPVGSNQWFGAVQVSAQAADTVSIDCLYLQPLDESSGTLIYTNVPTPSAIVLSKSPSTAANDAASGTVAWTNPSSVLAQDGAYATVALSGAQSSEYLKATGYGYSIPSTATINGIEVTLWYGSVGGGNWVPKLVKAGVVQAGSFYSFVDNPSSSIVDLGGPTDLWGVTWAPTDINASGFGVALQAQQSGGTATWAADYLKITVYYTTASGLAVAQDAVIYAHATSELRTDGAVRATTGGVYGPISNVLGDLPRIPPSGLEGRPVEVFVRATGGDFSVIQDAPLDSITAQVKYRPSFLYVGA